MPVQVLSCPQYRATLQSPGIRIMLAPCCERRDTCPAGMLDHILHYWNPLHPHLSVLPVM